MAKVLEVGLKPVPAAAEKKKAEVLEAGALDNKELVQVAPIPQNGSFGYYIRKLNINILQIHQPSS